MILFSPEFGSVMALDEDVVVSQRRGQQVLTYYRRGLDPDLRAAEVLLILTVRHFDIHSQQSFQVTVQFD